MYKKGFTVVELLIVIIIIAILSVIAFPHFINAQDRGKQSQTTANLRAISTVLAQYYVDKNTYPEQTGIDAVADFLISLGYAKSLPRKDGWNQAFGYSTSNNNASYSIWSCGKGNGNSCTLQTPKGVISTFGEQIIMTDGNFTQYPAGQQSEAPTNQ
jgi:general secretion pathway protein G